MPAAAALKIAVTPAAIAINPLRVAAPLKVPNTSSILESLSFSAAATLLIALSCASAASLAERPNCLYCSVILLMPTSDLAPKALMPSSKSLLAFLKAKKVSFK